MAALTDLLGATVVGKEGDVSVESLVDNDLIGIYFSAHWCPPCRGFTPMLAETYTTLKEAGKKFEVVFVSSDRSDEDFKSYYSEMPWLTIGFGSDKKGALCEKYGVSGIPCLVLVDKDGQTVTTEGRSKVSEDPTGQNFPWK
ncbi:hypothetical protein ACOMHN_037603 [Nucella lapillus]